MITIPSRYIDTGKRFSGGYGEIAVLHDSFLDRDVVLKVIHDVADRDQLQAELISMSEIRSKHVLQIYDLLLDEDGVLGIIEEYVPGADLTAVSTDKPYATGDFLRLAYQIASGLCDIHAHDIVHRDIKLNNMKFDSEGIVKLFDFGLSCESDEHVTTASRGTFVYRAPELYSPPITIQKAVDVYAFGIACWLLVTDKLPHVLFETPPQSSARVPSISSIASNLPAGVIEILDRSLSPTPEDRPSMAEIRDTIRQHLLFGQHRAWITGGHEVKTVGQVVSIGATHGKIFISYDGLRFLVRKIEGSVYVNNQSLSPGMELPGSSVITIGAPELGASRTFLEFNVSHPALTL